MSHQEEQKLLLEAAALRAKANKMRQDRMNQHSEASRKALAEKKLMEAKEKRDKEIRDFLLPLSKAFMTSGYRIKNNDEAYHTSIATKPVFRLIRSNAWPSKPIDIYWKDGFTENGFYWD